MMGKKYYSVLIILLYREIVDVEISLDYWSIGRRKGRNKVCGCRKLSGEESCNSGNVLTLIR